MIVKAAEKAGFLEERLKDFQNNGEWVQRDLNPGPPPRKQLQFIEVKSQKILVTRAELEEFLVTRELSGVTGKHIKEMRRAIIRYLKHVKFVVTKKESLEYFQWFQRKYSIGYYKKSMYSIMLFLTYLGVTWQNNIKLPGNPTYQTKRIAREDIQSILEYFKNHKYYPQIKALILLGANSGLRAEELYQLTHEDIDLEKRIVYAHHDPKSGQSTKTKRSRVSFFTFEAQEALADYFEFFEKDEQLTWLFGQTHLIRTFRDSLVQVKELRKFFSQEWDRRGGSTSIKKILMGHSLRGDVDLMHYNYQSEEDLKKIYDKVEIKTEI